jgi:hypothetical protein
MNNMRAPQKTVNGLFDNFRFREYPRLERRLFGWTLLFLHRNFGRQLANAYNWNWASRQIRGIVWCIW